MQEVAEVVEDKGQSVLIKVERHSACKKCDKNCGLAHNHDKDELFFEINKDGYSLKKGQRVKLELTEGSLVFSAVIVYLFPLIAMVMGYFVTDWLVSNSGIFNPGENINIAGSLLFFAVSFYIIRKINNTLKTNKNFEPEITEIIE